eukprot:m.567341 g.567341  ORF g.567341 m.567341 type:complete len:81 (-) comp22255_c0_seq7:1949-2191(-)
MALTRITPFKNDATILVKANSVRDSLSQHTHCYAGYTNHTCMSRPLLSVVVDTPGHATQNDTASPPLLRTTDTTEPLTQL